MSLQNTSPLLAIFLIIFLSSCNLSISQIKGKGPVVEKTYEFPKGFSGLEAMQAWKVNLIKADKAKVVIRTQENIHPYITPEVHNGKLSIGFNKKTSFKNISKQEADIYYTSLENIHASSASKITSDETFNQEKIKVNASSAATIELILKTKSATASASSASKIKLSGTSINFEGKASSASSIQASSLKAKKADLSTSSAGKIAIEVVDEVKANASSGSSITISGQPKTKNLHHSSGGSISQK